MTSSLFLSFFTRQYEHCGGLSAAAKAKMWKIYILWCFTPFPLFHYLAYQALILWGVFFVLLDWWFCLSWTDFLSVFTFAFLTNLYGLCSFDTYFSCIIKSLLKSINCAAISASESNFFLQKQHFTSVYSIMQKEIHTETTRFSQCSFSYTRRC